MTTSGPNVSHVHGPTLAGSVVRAAELLLGACLTASVSTAGITDNNRSNRKWPCRSISSKKPCQILDSSEVVGSRVLHTGLQVQCWSLTRIEARLRTRSVACAIPTPCLPCATAHRSERRTNSDEFLKKSRKTTWECVAGLAVASAYSTGR